MIFAPFKGGSGSENLKWFPVFETPLQIFILIG